MRKRLVSFALVAGLAALPALLACGRGAQGSGAVPPEFNRPITALDGTQTSLAKYAGKVVLVNFWATWCEPCQAEIPWLIELNRKYASKGLVIIGVAMDDEGKKVVEPYVKQHPFDVNGKTETMNYDVVLGNDTLAEQFGGVIGLPTSMLYARDGRKIKTVIGSILVKPDDLTKAVEAQF